MTTSLPKPGNGLPSREPCSACGKTGDRWMRRGWCASCYQRWDNNGRPPEGPPHIYRPKGSATGACAICERKDEWLTTHGWCMTCQKRWRRAGSPASGPPPPNPKGTRGRRPGPEGECPICGNSGKLRAREGWCRNCHMRWLAADKPGDKPTPRPKPISPSARRAADMDKRTRLRVMWALAHPGKENPYECAAPGCHETADPTRRHQCAMHDARIRRLGTYDLAAPA